MANAIITGIFKLIMRIFDILMKPLTVAISALFPSLAQNFTYITTFLLTYAFKYVFLLTTLLLVPSGALTMFFDYILIKYSIYLLVVVVKFAINVYNKLKI